MKNTEILIVEGVEFTFHTTATRHLLLVHPELIGGNDLKISIARLHDRARRVKNRGEIQNLSVDSISEKYGYVRCGV